MPETLTSSRERILSCLDISSHRSRAGCPLSCTACQRRVNPPLPSRVYSPSPRVTTWRGREARGTRFLPGAEPPVDSARTRSHLARPSPSCAQFSYGARRAAHPSCQRTVCIPFRDRSSSLANTDSARRHTRRWRHRSRPVVTGRISHGLPISSWSAVFRPCGCELGRKVRAN